MERDNSGEVRWATIAKGLGIILVVIGHYYPSYSPDYWVGFRSFIYSFHMPLFFMIAGYFAKAVDPADFPDMLGKKFEGLLSLFFAQQFCYWLSSMFPESSLP